MRAARSALALLALCAASGAGAAAPKPRAADPDAARALARLRANLAPLNDLSAEVTVLTTIKGFLTEQAYRQRYRYVFRRPGWVRVEFREPAGRVVVAKGKTVWVNGKRSQGADPAAAPGVPEESPVSLWALSLGSPEIDREYAVASFAEPGHQRLIGLNLSPRGATHAAVRLRLWVDAARGVVEESKVYGVENALLSTTAVTKFERRSGMWLPVEVTTLGCDGRCKTVVSYGDLRANTGVPASVFTP